MPIRFRYFPSRDLLIHVGEGTVSIEEIEALRGERRAYDWLGVEEHEGDLD